HEANAWGFSPADVPASIPGRVAIGVGMHAQLIRPKRIAALNIVYDTGPHDAGPGGVAEPVTCLPETIAASTLEAATASVHSTWIPLGVEFAETTTAVIEIPDGEHVMIIGPTRCGRSTAMARLVAGWSTAHRDGWVGVLAPRSQKPGSSTAGCSAALRATHRTVPELLAAMPDVGAALIAVDDAELVDDPSGALTTLAASRREGLLIVASAKPDVVRQTYGHWTAVVRRSRLGLIAAASSDLDGDLLGATLPRRLPVAARAGLMWLTSNGSVELIQVAVDGHRRPETSEARADRLGATPSGQADPASRRLAEEGVG
ncbi:MAG: hypothetical protein ABIQ39_10030, partial [Ilumatobacteraceae bacterium]